MTENIELELTSCSRQKAEGAFLALAAGDALGWPQELPRKVLERDQSGEPTTEFCSWVRRSGGRFYPHEETIHAGEYSDDTQLMLAVARCRTVSGTNWWSTFAKLELPLWTLYQRGGGGATKRAAKQWRAGRAPWKTNKKDSLQRYYNAGGNGVVMRILPHAVFHAGSETPEEMIRDVVVDGIATHGHPRALVGATAYAFAAWWLLRSEETLRFGELVDVLLDSCTTWAQFPSSVKDGWLEAASRANSQSYDVLWDQTVEEMCELLEQVRKGLKAGALSHDTEMLEAVGAFGKQKGAGTISAAAAFYLCARYASQPVQGVLRAAYAKGADTDTIAAMCGGLLGCLAGRDWLPTEWLEVQDAKYLRKIANKVAQGPRGAKDGSDEVTPLGRPDVDAVRDLLAMNDADEVSLGGQIWARTIDERELSPLSERTLAHQWKLQTSNGQTLYITKLGRRQESTDQKSSETTDTGHTAAEFAGIKLSVDDIRLAARFYEEVFGFTPEKRSSRFVSFGFLSLVDSNYAQQLSHGEITPMDRAGKNRLAISVDNLKRVFKRAQDLDVQLHPISRMPWGDLVFHCRDPEGNVIEVTERKK